MIDGKPWDFRYYQTLRLELGDLVAGYQGYEEMFGTCAVLGIPEAMGLTERSSNGS